MVLGSLTSMQVAVLGLEGVNDAQVSIVAAPAP